MDPSPLNPDMGTPSQPAVPPRPDRADDVIELSRDDVVQPAPSPAQPLRPTVSQPVVATEPRIAEGRRLEAANPWEQDGARSPTQALFRRVTQELRKIYVGQEELVLG